MIVYLLCVNLPFLSGPFYEHGLILIAAWISNYTLRKVLGEIEYPFPNYNAATVEVCEVISNFIQHLEMDVISYSCWD